MDKNLHLNATNQKIVPLLAQGMTQGRIAEEAGISRQRVNQIANQDNIREIVRAAQTQLINDNLNNVLYNQRRKIELAREIIDGNGTQLITGVNQKGQEKTVIADRVPGVDNKTILELADKAENRIGQGIGIFPTHTQSVQYIQLTAGRDMVLSDDVLDIIGRHVTEAIEGKVEEIEASTLQDAGDEGS